MLSLSKLKESSSTALSCFNNVSTTNGTKPFGNYPTESDQENFSSEDDGEKKEKEEEEDDEIAWSFIFTDDNYSGCSDVDEETRSNFSEGDIGVINDIISETASDLEMSQTIASFNKKSIDFNKHDNTYDKENSNTTNHLRTSQQLIDDASIATLKPPDESIMNNNITRDVDDSSTSDKNQLSSEVSSLSHSSKRTLEEITPDIMVSPEEESIICSKLAAFSILTEKVSLIHPAYLVLFALVLFDTISHYGGLFPSPYPLVDNDPTRIGVAKPIETSLFVVPDQKSKDSGNDDTTWSLIGKLGKSIWHDIEYGIDITEVAVVDYSGNCVDYIHGSYQILKKTNWSERFKKMLGAKYHELSQYLEKEQKKLNEKEIFWGVWFANIGYGLKDEYNIMNNRLAMSNKKLKSFIKQSRVMKYLTINHPISSAIKAAQIGLLKSCTNLGTYASTTSKNMKIGSIKISQKIKASIIPQSQVLKANVSNWTEKASQKAFKLYQINNKRINNFIEPLFFYFGKGTKTFYSIEDIKNWLDIRVSKYVQTQNPNKKTDEVEYKYIISWDDSKLDILKNNIHYPEIKEAIKEYYEKKLVSNGIDSDLEMKKIEFLLSVLVNLR